MSVPVQVQQQAVPWWQRRLCAFDTETTGPDPETARIVQAAVVHVGGGRPVEKRIWLVDPGVDIPAEAAAIHGISTEQVRDHGEAAGPAIEAVEQEMRQAWAAGEIVVICNAPYDCTVLDRELGRHHGVAFVVGGPIIDVRVLDKEADRFVGFHRKGSRKLDALCAHYKAQLDAAHDAAFDAIAAARVAYRIGQRFPELGNVPPDELHRFQATWYREQAKSLAEYFAKKGEGKTVDSFDWPLRARRPA